LISIKNGTDQGQLKKTLTPFLDGSGIFGGEFDLINDFLHLELHNILKPKK